VTCCNSVPVGKSRLQDSLTRCQMALQLSRVREQCCRTRCLGVSRASRDSLTRNLTTVTQRQQRSIHVTVLGRRCHFLYSNALFATTANPLFPSSTSFKWNHTINLRHTSALPPQPTAKGLADACAQQFRRLAKPPISKTGDWGCGQAISRSSAGVMPCRINSLLLPAIKQTGRKESS
jgi:hypothetical protein